MIFQDICVVVKVKFSKPEFKTCIFLIINNIKVKAESFPDRMRNPGDSETLLPHV